jgi:ketosteroid isomerase-like protein
MDVMDLIDQFNQTWADHDLDAALELCTDDCVFESTSPSPDRQRYEGKDEIRAAWKPIFDDVNARFETEDWFEAGDRFVALWRYNWSDGHVRGVDLFKARDGKVAEKFSYVKG